MKTLNKGDKVSFTTKFGNRVVGEFLERESIPTFQNHKLVYVDTPVILADGFGNGELIRCLVPENALTLVSKV